MTAEDPEAVLRDEEPDAEMTSGIAVLFVAFVLTVLVLGLSGLGRASIPLLAFVATVWLCGAGLRAAEVVEPMTQETPLRRQVRCDNGHLCSSSWAYCPMCGDPLEGGED